MTVNTTDRGLAVLSFAQEGLWFLDRLQPGSTAYVVTTALRLAGPLRAEALGRALAEIVRRHDTLRTTFTAVDGAPVQAVMPFHGFSLPIEDLSGLDAGEREAAMPRRASDYAAQPFDLAAGPPFRAMLLRLDDEAHVLLLCMHHMVSDRWSMGVLFRELSVLYDACREGRDSPLPPLAMQYADYAAWQRAQLQGDRLEGQLAYWKAQLAGVPDLIDLPTDHPRPAEQMDLGAEERLELPLALAERLKALGCREGATLFMVLLAAFQALLSRYTGSDDIAVGSPTAGRTRREVEPLIGYFANTLVLRTDLSGNPSFRELLRRVRAVTLGAYKHQDLPFDRLVAELRPERSLSYSPLFQVLFEVHHARNTALRLSGLRSGQERVGRAADAAKFDLMLDLTSNARGLRAVLSYRADLFEPSTARRMLRHLTLVMEQIAGDPDVRLSEIALADAAEHAQVAAWNRTDSAFPAYSADPADGCIHELIEAQAARTPHAAAVTFRGETLTYRDLDVASSRLAHHLIARGVRPETRVGVLAVRAPHTVVAILAILKAGGAYVPLDPAYPVDRLRYMLTDAAVRVLIAPAGLPDGVPSDLIEDLLDPRAEAAAITAHPARAPRVTLDPNGLAYLIYTSGSTGVPKGVLVPHGGIPNLACAQAERFAIDETSHVLQFASFSFDAAVAEMFATLVAGAALVLAAPEDLLPGPALEATLRRERISVVTLPPSVLALLAPHGLPALRTLVSAGEALPAPLVERWSADGRTMIDAYGPTEVTVCASLGECAPDGRVPTIGRPLANVQLHVLDAAGTLAPIGVPGELYVGGRGIARGYLGRAALTAEKFVPDPIGAAGGRVYRTGDRVRWRADGALEYLGRIDRQVKLRGFRIEPGEVERVLAAHPTVREARVLVREDTPGERRLAAYVVRAADGGVPDAVDLDALRAHLRRHVPEYMVPSAWAVLDRLPLTPNGKLHVKALPAPDAAPGPRYLPPRNDLEQKVAEIWSRVLALPRVGVHDRFFDLGGTSFLLYRVYSQLVQIRRDLLVVDLFRYTTVEELAAYLGAGAAHDASHLAASRARAAERRAARQSVRG